MTSNQVKPKICYAYMYIDACHYEPPLIYDWLQSLKRLKSILTSLENFSWWAETQLHELLIRVPEVVMFQKKYCVDLKLHADIGMLNPSGVPNKSQKSFIGGGVGQTISFKNSVC